ncbi:MAG TPA: DUF5777 family beta-barrel protein [Bacteroidales bacterium]|nr:DUF5777 family beta-barrel protein [Bacteroidales bacterium]
MRKLILTILSVITSIVGAHSQDIDKLLNEATENKSETEYVSATFKSTRIITGHSVERMPTRQLDFRISHRFGELNTGAYNLWGLDQANIHFSLEYGLTDWMMAGIGRGTYEKTYDGFLKFTLFRQSKGAVNMPVSISYLTTAAINTLKSDKPDKYYFWDRVSYVHQLLVARKFSEKFSFELNPTYVHRNLVGTSLELNDLFAMGAGARFKISKRVSVNAEYYAVFFGTEDYRDQKTYNPLSIGVDIETGGHVFQIHLTNSLAMVEKGFIGETTGQWTDGGIHIGFNVSRVFSFR